MTTRSIAIGSDGTIHIVYGEKNLHHAYFDGTWHTEIVDSADDYYIGKYASIALDSSNNPHIVYSQGSKEIKYAYFNGTWHIDTIDSNAYLAYGSSVALDASSNPHIVYYDESNDCNKWYSPQSKLWTQI